MSYSMSVSRSRRHYGIAMKLPDLVRHRMFQTMLLRPLNHTNPQPAVTGVERRFVSSSPRVMRPTVCHPTLRPPPPRSLSLLLRSAISTPTNLMTKANASGWLRCFSSLPPHEIVGLPSLSPTMESGSISAWNVKAGDTVVAGDVFASIETDKAVVDFEAQDDGIVAQILVPAGTEVKVNSPVMILVSDPKDVQAFENYKVEDSTTTTAVTAAVSTEPAVAVAAAASVATTIPTAAPVVASSDRSGGSVFASPLARKLAQEMGYDIAAIPGTGPSGRIIAADVKEYQPAAVLIPAATTSEPAPAATSTAAPVTMSAPVVGSGYVDYPIPASVSDVAARLAQSKRNVPHYYLTVDINADALIQLRKTVNAQLNAGRSKKDTNVETVGVYEFLIKAAGLAMRTIPSANAAWMDTHVRVYDSVDANIVTGAGESLNIRTIRNVTGIGIKSIMTELTKVDGEDEASDNGLGTFTMINVGMYGVKSCAPIIREPQACAIAIGALQNRILPSSSEDGIGFQQSVMFTVTASFDHRVVDGAVGAQWLAAFQSYIEHPSTLVL